ncbi:peptide ligase PGM1-related protein [Streptomyces sp. NPDC058401]|uniref:preATP grasp domain-containing protein n=1 Tax=Streptomyces sp. NPDC058401 TaxID=3346480 RepID=UPI0036537CD3
MAGTGSIVVFANFVSDLAVDLDEGQILTQWAQQAPRKAWLLRAGDVFVTPVPLSREFLRYVYDLTGVPPESVTVVEVPPAGAVPLARAVREAGLVEHVRALAGDRGAALLPTALDASAIAFARDTGLAVHPYPTVERAEAALETTMLLNTKTGFREAAGRLGMRLPAGRMCRRAEAAFTGYVSPLPPSCAHVVGELEEWGTALGLAFDPERGEGVVLYADVPPDGRSWRYAVIAASAGDVDEQEAELAEVFAFEGG